MVDTERMKRVLDRMSAPPPPPPGPLPPPGPPLFFGPELPRPPEEPPCGEWFGWEEELITLCGEIGRRSRALSGPMSRLRAASRRRRAVLNRFCGPGRRMPPWAEQGGGRDGIYRRLQRAEKIAGDLVRSYRRAAEQRVIPAWLANSAEESRRLLQREIRRIQR